MRFFLNHRRDACFNLALEEVLARELSEDFCMLWRNAGAVIVGRNQITGAEIDGGYVRARGIEVVRRITGGGAVYHDLGNLNYTLGTSRRLLGPEAFRIHAAPVVRVLRAMGVPAEFSGRNDLLAGGRKFSGAARSLFRDRTLFHGTLLFDTDLDVLEKALRPDEEKINAKGIRSVRSRVVNLREFLPGLDREGFAGEFGARIRQELGLARTDELPPELLRRAEELADRRYRRWEWNYGAAIPYDCRCRRHFPCGTVELRYSVRDNRIRDPAIHGDFFHERPVQELCAVLDGEPPDPDRIRRVLDDAGLAGFIPGLTAEEFLTLLA